METKEICRNFEFLMDPFGFLENLIKKILESDFKIGDQFMVWDNHQTIYRGTPPYIENRWGLIFCVCFSSNHNEKNFKQYENLVKLNGKTNIGKFFFYPIWVEVFGECGSINIVQIIGAEIKGHLIKISKLTPEIFISFLGKFANNPPKTKRECFEYHIPEIEEKDRPRLLEAMSTLGFKPNGFTRKTPVWTIELEKKLGAGK